MNVIIALYKIVIVVLCHALMPPRCYFAKSRALAVGNTYSHSKKKWKEGVLQAYLLERMNKLRVYIIKEKW